MRVEVAEVESLSRGGRTLAAPLPGGVSRRGGQPARAGLSPRPDNGAEASERSHGSRNTGPGQAARAGRAAPAAARDPDLPGDPGGRLLLCGQDRFYPAAAGRRQALLPLAPAAVREEPAAGHDQGGLRGERAAVPGTGGAGSSGAGGRPPGGAPGLQRRRLHPPGESASEHDGAASRPRTGGIPDRGARRRAGALRPSDPDAARADGAICGRAGGRIRQADPGCARRTGAGAGEPQLPAGALRGHQVP